MELTLPSSRRKKSKYLFMIMIIAAVSMIIIAGSVILQISGGAYQTSPNEVWDALFSSEVWRNPGFLLRLLLGNVVCDHLQVPEALPVSVSTMVVWSIRVPRVLVGLLVGLNLAFAGSIFQAITRNEMASPYLLGINQGAGLMISLILVLFPAMSSLMPLFAMLGGVAAFLIVYAIAWNHGASPVRLILAGVIVGAVASAIQTALRFMISDMMVMHTAMNWLSGSLIGTNWGQVRMILPWSILTVIICLSLTRYLDILMLGDQTATSLGLSVEKWRFILAFVGIMAAASSVAVAGLVGFVGLIVPHIIRSVVGSPHHRMFIGCLFVGPALMALADVISRLILNPIQLPVGTITGTVGGIFFLFMMRRKKEFGRL
ncbi:MAG: iron ABC transporter permease [Planctomycetia bacterium]|nr:iron ABC transporter permease [Planctomycetia bacterium]